MILLDFAIAMPTSRQKQSLMYLGLLRRFTPRNDIILLNFRLCGTIIKSKVVTPEIPNQMRRIFILSSLIMLWNLAFAVKCGTPQAMAEFFERKAPLVSPDLTLSFETEHFVLHYDTSGVDAVYPGNADGDSVPDYIEISAEYLEYVWIFTTDTLGYILPLPDSIGFSDPEDYGGNTKADVYFSYSALGSEHFYGKCVLRDSVYQDGRWKACLLKLLRI